MNKNRLGIMGGTFDPIHNGHLIAANEVAHVFNLKKVLFVPTGNFSYKRNNITHAHHRYVMTEIATVVNPLFSVSKIEVNKKLKSYTYNTLKELKKKYCKFELFFITGADAISNIFYWKKSNDLMKLAHFIGVTRPGYCFSKNKNMKNVIILEIPAMSISSTNCRERIRKSMPIWYLMPNEVVWYIKKHNLYRNTLN